MKKLVAAIATTGFVFTGVAAINVSAAEHEVQERDTLWGIAQEHGISVEKVMEENGLDSTIIHPGQIISIDETEGKEAENAELYIVEKGDTLSQIGSEYNVSVDQLMEWNNLSSTLIQIGQELNVHQTNVTTEEEVAVEETSNQAEESTEVEQNNTSEKEAAEGETMTVTATAYTAKCEGCSGVTATGIDLNANPNKKVVAVDPDVIPLGTEVYVEGYGNAIAGDTGGAIKGNKIDIHVPTKNEANSWGVRTVDITILD